jgi:hypothetical protein
MNAHPTVFQQMPCRAGRRATPTMPPGRFRDIAGATRPMDERAAEATSRKLADQPGQQAAFRFFVEAREGFSVGVSIGVTARRGAHARYGGGCDRCLTHLADVKALVDTEQTMIAKCPKCDRPTTIELERSPAGGPSGFIAVCAKCRTILGVMPDLNDIAATVANVVKAAS